MGNTVKRVRKSDDQGRNKLKGANSEVLEQAQDRKVEIKAGTSSGEYLDVSAPKSITENRLNRNWSEPAPTKQELE